MTFSSELPPETCAFCDVVAGRSPATMVACDPLTVAFLDLRQFHPGHVLVVPRAHIADVRGADDATGTLDQWGARLRAALAVLALLWAMPAAAQPAQRVEAAVHVVAAAMPQFEGSDLGIGGRLAWHADDLLSFEGELTFFPSDYPDHAVPFSSRRVEGLFGLTAGLRFGVVRPFAKFRAGFLDVAEAPEPFACIQIFPPPLSCTLGGGRTLPAFDVGGGVDVNVTRRTFVRIEAGDRMLKYPAPALDADGVAHDQPFFAHGLRFAAGVGLRF
jgi:hypothetical protein